MSILFLDNSGSNHTKSCTQRPAGLGDPVAEDGVSAQDAARQKALRAAQTNPRTGVRHHQIGDGLSPMSVARARKRQRRMEFGDHELEHQANVRDADLLRGHRYHSPYHYWSTSP